MESGETVRKGWKETAREYFFESYLSIEEISILLDISRQSISAHLKTFPEYQQERQRRKRVNEEKRKEYKQQKNRQYRQAGQMAVTGESLKREHEIAVRILSAEKY